MWGNKVFTIKPDREEKLREMQVWGLPAFLSPSLL
jgi:hypothetical protein